MKRVEAYVRVQSLETVRDALIAIGIHALSAEQVRGYGRQQGQNDHYRGSTYALNLVPKIKIEVVVEDGQVDEVVETIAKAVHTGEIGDGKIFVSPILGALRIRTGERGDAALN